MMEKEKKTTAKKKAVEPKASKASKKKAINTEKPKIEKVEIPKMENVDPTPKPKEERFGYLKRDLTKYELNGNGEKLGKGKFVLALVKLYVSDKPKTSFDDLCKAFPAELQKGYKGVFAKTAEVKKNNLSARYFMENDQIIKTIDGVAISVTREFGAGNILVVVEHAKKLGYKVKEHKEEA